MILAPKLGAHGGAWGNHANRFNPKGYQEPTSLLEIIRQVAQIPGLRGLDLSRPMFDQIPLQQVKAVLVEHDLKVISIAASISGSPRWLRGALTNPDPQLRRQAVQIVKETMDLVAEFSGQHVNLWFGREGHDYCFESDYETDWQYLVEGVRECALYRPNVRIAIEYKQKEPLAHLTINSAATTLLLCEEVGAPNVGVLLDTGHALIAQENLAEVATLLARKKRLFHLHLNDNYRLWDDDMTPGSVHLVEFLEMFYWLDRVGYTGWIMFDAQPPGYAPIEVMKASVAFVQGVIKLLERLDRTAIETAISRGDGVACQHLVQRALFDLPESHVSEARS